MKIEIFGNQAGIFASVARNFQVEIPTVGKSGEFDPKEIPKIPDKLETAELSVEF